jgi:hypothetical protein
MCDRFEHTGPCLSKLVVLLNKISKSLRSVLSWHYGHGLYYVAGCELAISVICVKHKECLTSYTGKSDAKTGLSGTGSARSVLGRSSSTSGTHSSGGSEKPGLSKRRGKKRDCHSPLGNVLIIMKSFYQNCAI